MHKAPVLEELEYRVVDKEEPRMKAEAKLQKVLQYKSLKYSKFFWKKWGVGWFTSSESKCHNQTYFFF